MPDLWASRFRAHHSRLRRQDSSLHATRRLNELSPITRIDTARVSIAPVILGRGKRLFDYFDETVNLEHVGLLQSPFRHTYQLPHRVLRMGGSRDARCLTSPPLVGRERVQRRSSAG
jgi:hypothetical protein